MPAVLNCKVQIGLPEALAQLGISQSEVLAAARLPADLFATPGPRVSVREYFALWAAIAAVSGDPAVGLRLVAGIKLDYTEPMFLAVLTSRDVAEAVAMVSRYKRIFEPQGLDITAAGGDAAVVLPSPDSDAEQPEILVDIQLAFIVEMCRRGTHDPGFRPKRVELKRADIHSAHAAYFGCPMRGGAAANALVFDGADMTRPFLTHNPQLQHALLPYLAANTPARTDSVIERVRSVLAERIRGRRPSLEDVGRELAMSGRAIQRVLRDNNTTFRRVLDDVRNEQARGYLSSTSFSDAEVAFLLGYEEANSFARAFRSWNGVSPGQFRRRMARANG